MKIKAQKVIERQRFYKSLNKLVYIHKMYSISEAIKDRGEMAKCLKKKRK